MPIVGVLRERELTVKRTTTLIRERRDTIKRTITLIRGFESDDESFENESEYTDRGRTSRARVNDERLEAYVYAYTRVRE
jgi:hypothetical protein